MQSTSQLFSFFKDPFDRIPNFQCKKNLQEHSRDDKGIALFATLLHHRKLKHFLLSRQLVNSDELLQYGINQISSDKRRLVGLFFADLWNDLMDVTRMNVTYVEERFTGSCSDSGQNFTGILHSLYHDQSDWTIMPLAELNCSHVQAFDYGTVFMDTKNTLVHMHPRINGHRENAPLDIIGDIPFGKYAKAVNLLIYLVLWWLIVVASLMAKWFNYSVKRIYFRPRSRNRVNYRSYIAKKLLSTASHILQVFTRQGFEPSSKRISVRYLWILFMIHAFVSSTIYFSVFKTDLFKPREVTLLNNLHDLATSKKPPFQPRLPVETNTWKLFADSKVEPMKSVWKRANETGEALIRYSLKHMIDFMPRMIHENWAIISHFNNNRFLVDAYCMVFETSYPKSQMHHSKGTFLHSPTGVVFRKELDRKSKRKITTSFSMMSQSGFHDYYDRNPLGLLRKFPVQLRCYRMLEETSNFVQEEKVSKLSLVHYHRLLQIVSGAFAIAFFSLLYEIKMNKLMGPRRKPKTFKSKKIRR